MRTIAKALVAAVLLAPPAGLAQATGEEGKRPWQAEGNRAAVATEHILASEAALSVLRDGLVAEQRVARQRALEELPHRRGADPRPSLTMTNWPGALAAAMSGAARAMTL